MTRTSSGLLLICLLSSSTALFSQAAKKLVAARVSVPKTTTKTKRGKPLPVLSERERAVHAINRLTFGERPGDVDRVLAMGVDKWIEQQVNPADIPNQALDSKLAVYHSLKLQPPDLIAAFPSQQLIQAIAEGKKPMPSNTDALQYGLYEVLVDRYNEQRRKNAAAAAAQQEDEAAKKAAADKQKADAKRVADTLLALANNQRMPALMQMPVADRRALIAIGDQRDRLVAESSPVEREVLFEMNGATGVATAELQQAKLLRAIYSERQLEEVMTDFWFNHFNVYLNKDWDQYYTTSYERDVIRAHALGKFSELLLATAQSPAMLYYLDNWTSTGPNSPAAGGPKPANSSAAKPQERRGLNENYAREVMELHTLGVDGGYTQADVTELARVLTGWTIRQPDTGGPFVFDPKKHEPGTKTVLGRTIFAQDNGREEGLQMLEVLAHHPSTARFISTKLARRFVSDNPPDSLVNRMSATFLDSDGDIREVLRTMFHSREFWSAKSYRAKVKTPLEFVASTIRATGADIINPQPLVQTLGRMGMPLYQMQPPTGYSSRSDYWMNSDALIDRLNFAVNLQNNKIGGVKMDAGKVLALSILNRTRGITDTTGLDAAVALLGDGLLGADISKQTRATIRKQLDDPENAQHLLDDPQKPLGTVIALILGSPEFQQR